MGLGRLVVIVLLVVVAVWLLRRALRRPGQGPDGAGKPAAPGELVRCAHCGMHLPLAEARAREDRVYCSEEHARLGPGKG